MGRVTLSDVARLAGVDVSTASRVLRGEARQRVREEVREKILQVARQLEYSPDLLARALRTARTYSLGLAVPQIDNPVYSDMIRGAERAATEAGYSLLILYRARQVPGSGALRQLSQAHRVDGLLVASFDSDEQLLDELERAGVPYVVLNRALPGVAHSVVLDTRSAARMAVEHLLSLGHRRIAHLGGRSGGYNANERLLGYKEALHAGGVAFDPSLVVAAGYTAEGGAEALGQLMRQASPSAIFAATLVSAAGALSAMHRRGISIPQDISVVALHDAPVAEILYPPLTTVATPTYDMGRLGAELLVSLLNGEEPLPLDPLPPLRLIMRASTAPYSR
jgi:LacI family transcriptional regulator